MKILNRDLGPEIPTSEILAFGLNGPFKKANELTSILFG